MSPLARSLKWLREAGYLSGVTERRLPHARNVTVDLFGFADIVAAKPGLGVLAVQATSGQHVSDRLAKIRTHDPEAKSCPHCNALFLLACGWRIVVHGWRKNAEGRWVLREEAVEAIASACACGHVHLADSDGSSGPCQAPDCCCFVWHEVVP